MTWTTSRAPAYLARPRHAVALSTIRLVVATALVWVAVANGWWWATLVVGLVVGLTTRRRLACWTIGVGAGALGWGLPLLWMSFFSPLGAASTDLSSLMGYSFSPLAVVVTVLVGTVLAVCGTWLGRVVRSFTPRD